MLKSLQAGLSDEQIEVITAQGKEATILIKQMIKVADEKVRACEKARRSRKNYQMSSWSQYQADCNGYIRAIDEVLNVLKSFSDKGTTNV